MSSSDKIPPVLGSPSATDAKEVAAAVTVAATAAEATEASESDAVVTDVAAAGDGAAPTLGVASCQRYGRAINTTSNLGLPSHNLQRNQHGETRDTRQTQEPTKAPQQEEKATHTRRNRHGHNGKQDLIN